jgi:hypothetical protein
MKRTAILSMVVLLTVFASAAMADEGVKKGRLHLFQKCDGSLMGTPGYDAAGCPDIGTGPWPVLPDAKRHGYGRLEYSLWGEKFVFSFQGHKLPPRKDYTLIYYPDPWPGSGLICLGSGRTNKGGNIEIHGKKEIGTGLPASYDANFSPAPASTSGAVGAKIWLVLTEDVDCFDEATMQTAMDAKMTAWNPTAYLFEFNLMVYEHRETLAGKRPKDHEKD